KETIEAARFPTVELKAIVDGIAPPAAFPNTVEKVAKGQLLFHGVTTSIEIPVKITFERADKIVVGSSFLVSLDAFKIDRPSLMFVKVEDELKIEAAIVLVK